MNMEKEYAIFFTSGIYDDFRKIVCMVSPSKEVAEYIVSVFNLFIEQIETENEVLDKEAFKKEYELFALLDNDFRMSRDYDVQFYYEPIIKVI